MGVDCMYSCSGNSVALCSVNHCSREEPASHSPTVPWVCDARYTGACLGRPYLRAFGCVGEGQVLFEFRSCNSVRRFKEQTITKRARFGVGKSVGRNGYITS